MDSFVLFSMLFAAVAILFIGRSVLCCRYDLKVIDAIGEAYTKEIAEGGGYSDWRWKEFRRQNPIPDMGRLFRFWRRQDSFFDWEKLNMERVES